MASTKNLKAVPTTGTMPRLDTKKIHNEHWHRVADAGGGKNATLMLHTALSHEPSVGAFPDTPLHSSDLLFD